MLICFCKKEFFVVGFLLVALVKLQIVLQNDESKEIIKEARRFLILACACYNNTTEFDEFNGEWCWLQEIPCTMGTGTVAPYDWTWVKCLIDGASSTDCDAPLDGICTNCIGCLFDNFCYPYDPTGELGPTNTTDCAQGGGVDCSDILENLTCASCTGCIYQGLCYDYDPTAENGPPTIETCTTIGGESCVVDLQYKMNCDICYGCIYENTCFSKYSRAYNGSFLENREFESCIHDGGTDCREPKLKNAESYSESCWENCFGQQGPCSWCGTEGMCCSQNWPDKSNGCDGTIGGQTRHECSLKRKTFKGSYTCISGYCHLTYSQPYYGSSEDVASVCSFDHPKCKAYEYSVELGYGQLCDTSYVKRWEGYGRSPSDHMICIKQEDFAVPCPECSMCKFQNNQSMCMSDEERRVCIDVLKDVELIEWKEKNAPCQKDGRTDWLCGDKCISLNDPCNSTCNWVPLYQCSVSGAEKFIKNPVVFDPISNQCLDTYNENQKPNIKAFLSNAGRLYCGKVFTACKGHFPGQCIPNNAINNNVYDCLDRSDEYVERLGESNVEADIDYNQSAKCYVPRRLANLPDSTSFYGPGMRCGAKQLCIPFSLWCRNWNILRETVYQSNYWDDKIWPQDCPLINDKVLCSNNTFWKNQNRPMSNYCEFHCKGTYPGQCISNANVCNNETRSLTPGSLNCLDYSDETCSGVNFKKCEGFGYSYCDDMKQCVHQRLVCDGIYNCDDESDELPSKCGTDKCVKPFINNSTNAPNFGLSQGFSCASLDTNVTICATVCDGNTECFGNLDEIDCQKDNIKFLIAILLFCMIITLFWNEVILRISSLLLKVTTSETKNSQVMAVDLTVGVRMMLNLECKPPTKDNFEKAILLMDQLHKSSNHSLQFEFLVSLIESSFEEQIAQNMLKMIYDLELKHHGESWIIADECIKQNLIHGKSCQTLMDVVYPGIMAKYLPDSLKTCIRFVLSIFQHWTMIWIVVPIKVFSYYIDLGKDLILLYAISIQINPSLEHVTRYSFQVVTCYSASILVPLIVNSMKIVFYELEPFYGYSQDKIKGKKAFVFRAFAILFTFFAPAFVIYRIEKLKAQMSILQLKISNNVKQEGAIQEVAALYIQVDKLQKEISTLKELLASHTKIDLVEVFFQAVLLIILYCVGFSYTNTVSGFESSFKTDKVWIYVSIFLSIKKICTASVKIQAINKNGFFGVVGSIVYGMFVIYSVSIRFLSVVMYFGIPMGLFNLLVHWYYETANVEWRGSSVKSPDLPFGYSEFNTSTGQYDFVNIEDIKEQLLSKDKEGRLLKYTGLSLGQYYAVFFSGLILHYLLVLLILRLKAIFTEEKRMNINGMYLSHVFSSIVLPEVFEDWDMAYGNNINLVDENTQNDIELDIIKKYRKMWKWVRLEFVFMIMLHLIENLAMLCPLFFATLAARERQNFLESTIGPIPQETMCLENLHYLTVVMACLVSSAIPIQIFLISVYYRMGHPWSNFFKQF